MCITIESFRDLYFEFGLFVDGKINLKFDAAVTLLYSMYIVHVDCDKGIISLQIALHAVVYMIQIQFWYTSIYEIDENFHGIYFSSG